jgi:tetratricopeptide (TPR) repeat protein
MTRSAKLLLTLALTAVALPGAVRAQTPEPKDNKWTKEATKSLTIASIKGTPAEKTQLYQTALASLKEAMANPKEQGNAKVWLLAGQAYAGLGQLPQADSALKKAEELYPGYKAEIEAAREQAWLNEFKAGSDMLDHNQSDSAAVLMEAAEKVYDQRPEAQLNLGVIYLNAQKYEQADVALQLAKQRLAGPLFAKLKPEDQTLWKNWDQLVDNLRAQIQSNKGILAFRNDDFDEAVTDFGAAYKINPASRDYIYNLAESLFAKSARLERQRSDAEDALTKASPTPAPGRKAPAKSVMADSLKDSMQKLDAALAPIWTQLIDAANKLLPVEPANSDVYIMLAKAYRGQSLASHNAAEQKALQDKAIDALNKGTALPFEVTELSANYGDTSAVNGKIKNHTLKAGEQAKIHVTFLAIDGTPVGTADVSVAVGAADSLTPFEAKAETKGGRVAGWKYAAVAN